jgi:hypothetical protein
MESDMNTSHNALAVALALVLSTAGPLANAQTDAKVDEAKPVLKVNHAGGPRHDMAAHEASIRAKQNGVKLTEPVVHPGGRHNEDNHKAAIRAQDNEVQSARSADGK